MNIHPNRELVLAERQHSPAMDFQRLFALGMKRQLPELVTCDGPSLDIGASGKYVVPGAVALGAPDWMFPRDLIPAEDDSVATIHCYHFLEHLTGEHSIAFLREVERVLIPERGVMNFSVPYYNSIVMAQNLEHRSSWCEETFPCLFGDDTYEYAGKWRLQVGFQIVAGVVNYNMALLGQLKKSDHASPVVRDAWFYPTH